MRTAMKIAIRKKQELINKIFEGVSLLPIDHNTIPQEKLDLANKNRASIFPWRGQFSPELIELLISNYAKADAIIYF